MHSAPGKSRCYDAVSLRVTEKGHPGNNDDGQWVPQTESFKYGQQICQVLLGAQEEKEDFIKRK